MRTFCSRITEGSVCKLQDSLLKGFSKASGCTSRAEIDAAGVHDGDFAKGGPECVTGD